MRTVINIKKESVSSDDGDFEETPLSEIIIAYEGGFVRADYVWQSYLDHAYPGKPNRFSIARKLDNYKPKVQKYGS